MGIGAPELIIILIIVLVIFGAGRLPQVLGSLGKGVKEFREASEGHEETTTATTSTTATNSTPTTPLATPPVASTSVPVETVTATRQETKTE
jgi:sec-independent protein translocase protein TatA